FVSVVTVRTSADVMAGFSRTSCSRTDTFASGVPSRLSTTVPRTMPACGACANARPEVPGASVASSTPPVTIMTGLNFIPTMAHFDLEQQLELYGELTVKVGLNVQPGQRLLIIGPLAHGGASLEAAPLVRHVA